MQIANVKHSHCEAKLGFRVWETKFGRVRRKTSPAISDGLVGFGKSVLYQLLCSTRHIIL